jgi:hypothetical protein
MFRAITKVPVHVVFLACLLEGVGMAQSLTITSPSQLLPALVGVSYSTTFTATGGTPPYTWSPLTTLPIGFSLTNSGVLSGMPSTNAQSFFTIRVMDTANNFATQNFSIQIGNAGTLVRTGVLAQLAAGAGWDTTVYLVNTSAAINAANVLFRDDGGNPLTLQFTAQQQGLLQTMSASTPTFVLNPNTTVTLHTTAPAASALVQGWADVKTTGGISAFAIFKQTLPNGVVAEGTSSQQGQFQPSVVIPYDNTTGSTTTAGLVNLANIPVNVTATIWDENGVQLTTQFLTIAISAHMAFAVPTQFPVTAGKRGIVRFDNTSSMDALAALGLSFSSLLGNSFTSIPALLP